MNNAAKVRTIDGVLALKAALDAKVPAREAERNLFFASWNIKEFGHTTQRLPEAYFWITEVLSRFHVEFPE